ncbi:hypothetical protein B0J12DRAFT_310004 [Macrophomina phaseolina]|uniref:BHLH domain-containing protein n=1 Tax=Macrophomina phaseolina TaxID=35725 RepID=A0ABQ8FWQ0_9PEZI|nr:hypothetical protein B0J12DRAFT_310004 [Macrophomina phaseolina]
MMEDHKAPASPKDEQRHAASPYTKTSRSRRKSAPSLPSTTPPKSIRNARRSARLSQQRQGNNSKPQDFRQTGPVLHYPAYDGSIATAATLSSSVSPAKPFSSSFDSSDGPPARRVPHKAVERRYRESMKTMFDRLRSVVPAPKNKCSSSTGSSSGGGGPENADGDIVFVDSAAADLPPSPQLSSASASSASSSPTRLTKAGVMSRAVEYIEEMETEIERMRACYAGALQENERLKHAALELETRLSIPHCGGFGGTPGNECCAIT